VTALDAFFADVDEGWKAVSSTSPIPLRLIGSSALMLQESRYQRGTKDSDIWETEELTPAIREALLRLAGRNSTLHRRHHMYLEVVPAGLPFFPQNPVWHRVPMTPPLRHLDVHVLDIVDVVVSKLIRFHADDQSDIQAMIDAGRVLPDRLVDRFRAAADFLLGDARERELPACVENLHRVERDMLGVAESLIDLPGWL
jgi:hypothetical protein